jgi:hypothetical protein
MSLKGAIHTKWGRVEVHEADKKYHIIAIEDQTQRTKKIGQYDEFAQANSVARKASQKPFASVSMSKLDLFDEGTRPDNTAKDANPYQAPHDDYDEKGPQEPQQGMDILDIIEQRFNDINEPSNVY